MWFFKHEEVVEVFHLDDKQVTFRYRQTARLLKGIISSGRRRLIIDMSEVNALSIKGYEMLISVAEYMADYEGKMALIHCSNKIENFMNASRLADILPVHPTLLTAKQAFETETKNAA